MAFGGVLLKNGQISQGGCGRHVQRGGVQAAAAAGVQFVNISPIRTDVLEKALTEWLAPRPSTDVAVMLGLAHTLLSEGLHDQAFLDGYTTGFDTFRAYLMGANDGVPKTAKWAARVSEIPAYSLPVSHAAWPAGG